MGDTRDKVGIIIAAYNEENMIAKVIKRLHSFKYKHIFVVDDCSRDKTSQVALDAGSTVLRHIINRGQGAALRTGIEFALKDPALDYFVTFDADGQHEAAEIESMVNALQRKHVDIALGSRFLTTKSNVPLAKRFALKGGIMFTFFTSGLLLTDAHNGFRALTRKAAKKIRIRQDRMEHASEIIDEVAKQHLTYTEVPVTITYSDYSMSKGQGALRAISIAFNIIIKKLFR